MYKPKPPQVPESGASRGPVHLLAQTTRSRRASRTEQSRFPPSQLQLLASLLLLLSFLSPTSQLFSSPILSSIYRHLTSFCPTFPTCLSSMLCLCLTYIYICLISDTPVPSFVRSFVRVWVVVVFFLFTCCLSSYFIISTLCST